MASMADYNGIDAQEVLTFLLQTGSLKLDDVAADMKKAERRKILKTILPQLLKAMMVVFELILSLKTDKENKLQNPQLKRWRMHLLNFILDN